MPGKLKGREKEKEKENNSNPVATKLSNGLALGGAFKD